MRTAIDQVGIAVFAKAPIAGFAKTRLIPEIGAERAAALQARLIERAVATALEARLGPVSLWCTPDQRHALFTLLASKHGINLHDQAGPDLGARMLHVFETFTPAHPLLLIGSDCPALETKHLALCADALRTADAVFLPAEDGGYVLVGMSKPIPELFVGIPWGSDRVMEETRACAARAQLRVVEPATLWDIDGGADYARAAGLSLI
jgi:rSAM/selenodomain-associated transferase 1